ncbi:MAG: hypothetical protein HAW61_04585 [Candidatus Portiera sp.]|nr:hypothetical protein [Portiera sp.]
MPCSSSLKLITALQLIHIVDSCKPKIQIDDTELTSLNVKEIVECPIMDNIQHGKYQQEEKARCPE